MKRQREERPKKIYYTGHEVKSCKEYNIPLRNNKCNLYRTRGRIPAKDDALRHAKGGAPRCCCCDSRVTGAAAALLSWRGHSKHKWVPAAARKMWWSLYQNNKKTNKRRWIAAVASQAAVCFSKILVSYCRATTKYPDACCKVILTSASLL